MNKAQKEVERLNKKLGTHLEVIPQEERKTEIEVKNNYNLEVAKFKWEKKIFQIKLGIVAFTFVLIVLIYLTGLIIILSI